MKALSHPWSHWVGGGVGRGSKQGVVVRTCRGTHGTRFPGRIQGALPEVMLAVVERGEARKTRLGMVDV